jgi:hypothetical protein
MEHMDDGLKLFSILVNISIKSILNSFDEDDAISMKIAQNILDKKTLKN